MELNFQKFLEDKWNGLEVNGWEAYTFKEKLKIMKGYLKQRGLFWPIRLTNCGGSKSSKHVG